MGAVGKSEGGGGGGAGRVGSARSSDPPAICDDDFALLSLCDTRRDRDVVGVRLMDAEGVRLMDAEGVRLMDAEGVRLRRLCVSEVSSMVSS